MVEAEAAVAGGGVQCTVYSVQCTVGSVQCTVFSVQWAVFSGRCSVGSVQLAVYSGQWQGSVGAQKLLFHKFFSLASFFFLLSSFFFLLASIFNRKGAKVARSSQRFFCHEGIKTPSLRVLSLRPVAWVF